MPDLSVCSSLRTAFADESFSEHPTDGFYVIAAVVLDSASCEEVRDAMLGLRFGDPTSRDMLDNCVHEIDVGTDC